MSLRNYILYAVLRGGSWLVGRVPVRVAYALASATAVVAFLMARPARRGIEANLAIAFPSVPHEVRRRIALAAFRHNGMNWVDTLRIPALTPAEIPGSVDVDRWNLLAEAFEAGNGVILAMLHVGNYDLVGQALAARGIPLTVPVERIQPERLYRFLAERRAAQGIHLLPVEQASRGLLGALGRGEVIGIAADRLASGRGVEVEFFSHRTEFARGPAALAVRSGAVLFVAVGIRQRGSAFRGFVVPVDVSRTGNNHADELAVTQRLADIAESFVSSFPQQWLAFSPVWNGQGTRADAPATMSQQKEAAR